MNKPNQLTHLEATELQEIIESALMCPAGTDLEKRAWEAVKEFDEYLIQQSLMLKGFNRVEGLPKMTELVLNEFERNKAVIDSEYAHGRASYVSNRIGFIHIIERIKAGEPIEEVRKDYGLTRDEMDELLEVTIRNPKYVSEVETAFYVYEGLEQGSNDD